ncbi:MAG: ABC transporter permease subunit [Anaerolineae bacterium]|nr:ABC transporter permease subunit [Anaerolineae bacterium]
MTTSRMERGRASTDAVYRWLRAVPWWGVIVAIVGLIVAYSALSDIQYREAIAFLFDLPWHKELLQESTIEGEAWAYTPDVKLPLEARTYRLYAEFHDVRAVARVDSTVLRAEPDHAAAVTGELPARERVKFVRWYVIPQQGLQLEQRWVYVVTDEGQVGWASDKAFSRARYERVAQSPPYVIRVPDGATPGETEPIDGTGDEPLVVSSSTPTIRGTVPGGVAVRVYERYTWTQVLARVWRAKGVAMTVRATLLGYGLALCLGLIAGLMLVSKNPIPLAIAKLYVEVVRGIPLLVIILYAGFVLSPALRDATNGQIDLRGFPGAVIGLGFGYGAYLAEVFRAGIQSIHSGQMEAARSLGMSYFQAMRHVILPQALRVVLPPLGNDFIAMLKDSSLISVVALPEILQQGRLWVSRTFRAFEGYNTVALFYLVMTLLLSLLVRLIERRTALPGRTEE